MERWEAVGRVGESGVGGNVVMVPFVFASGGV